MSIKREDVARKAGVSPAVVSYVLNNGPRPVAPETRERVLAAVRELGYRANHLARSLRSQRSQMLGIIVPDASNAFYSEVAKGVEDTAYKAQYGVILGNTNGDTQRQTAYVESMVSRQVDAIIFVTLTVEPAELELLEQFNVPAVYVHPEGVLDATTLDRINYISVDFDGGGYAVGTHLLERGHRRLVALTGNSAVRHHPEGRWHRVEGFLRALAEAGVQAQVLRAGEHAEDGYRVALDLLRGAERPTAIFAGNDLLAIGVLRAAQDLGLSVPHNLAICGFDDIAMTQFMQPRLTTVQVQKYKMGTQAARMVLLYLADPPGQGEPPAPEDRHLHFETTLVVREST